MPQVDEETESGAASTSPSLRPSADAWAALEAAEEDLESAVATLSRENDDDNRDVIEAAGERITMEAAGERITIGADDAAVAVAEANVAAVEAAVEEAEIAEAAATRAVPALTQVRGGAVTIPLLCAGIAIIAACLLIPQADANRRLAYERVKLQADLEAVEKQVTTNDDFLRKVADNANLAERLAQRQMKIIRRGSEILSLKNDGDGEMSPFQLTAVPPAAELAPYEPHGGMLAAFCYDPKSRLYLIGVGLMVTAAGLVLEFGPKPKE